MSRDLPWRIHTRILPPEFTWDQRKSDRNFAERGFDFALASTAFADLVIERPDTRQDYGENRRVAVGIADGRILTIVYTHRTEPGGRLQYRIISARMSNRYERKAYVDETQRGL